MYSRLSALWMILILSACGSDSDDGSVKKFSKLDNISVRASSDTHNLTGDNKSVMINGDYNTIYLSQFTTKEISITGSNNEIYVERNTLVSINEITVNGSYNTFFIPVAEIDDYTFTIDNSYGVDNTIDTY